MYERSQKAGAGQVSHVFAFGCQKKVIKYTESDSSWRCATKTCEVMNPSYSKGNAEKSQGR